jgi:hypothetical protein
LKLSIPLFLLGSLVVTSTTIATTNVVASSAAIIVATLLAVITLLLVALKLSIPLFLLGSLVVTSTTIATATNSTADIQATSTRQRTVIYGLLLLIDLLVGLKFPCKDLLRFFFCPSFIGLIIIFITNYI